MPLIQTTHEFGKNNKEKSDSSRLQNWSALRHQQYHPLTTHAHLALVSKTAIQQGVGTTRNVQDNQYKIDLSQTTASQRQNNRRLGVPLTYDLKLILWKPGTP